MSPLGRAAVVATLCLCFCLPGIAQTAPGSIWAAPVNAIAGQNSLTKSGGCDGCYDAGAATSTVIQGGNAVAEFSFSETKGLREVGLAHAFSVNSGSSIDFGLRIQGGYAEVREDGAYRSDTTAEPGVVFRIAVESGVASYSKNGAVFYTSSAPVQYPLVFGAILASANSDVQGVTFSGSGAGSPPPPTSALPASWILMSQVSVDRNNATKTSGCEGCYDAFVQALQAIKSKGYVEFTVGNSALSLVAGLAQAFTPGDSTSIDFGISVHDGLAEVRENGVYRSDIPAPSGAVFRITIGEGVVTYSKDGSVFYSGPAAPSKLSFAALFASIDASISNVLIANLSERAY